MVLAGLGGLIFGIVNLVRPLGRLHIETRAQAGAAVAGSLVVMLIGGALLPSEDGDPEATVPTSTVLSPVPTTSLASATTVPETTTSSVGSSTTTLATSTTSSSTSTTTGDGTLALDLLMTIPVELETPDGYDRDLFPHWSDEDGDRCDTREEVLIRDSGGTADVGSGCAVTTGLWYSVYDGVWLDRATQLDVDHVLALKEAWDSGANEWTTFQREQFANDLDDPHALIAVSSSSNQSKGAADPSNWLPENPDDQCRYVVAWVIVKARWELSMDESEHGRIRNLLTGPCEGATLDEGLPVRPPPPITTTTLPTSTTVVEGDADVVIANIVYDAPGNDVVYNDSEYVVLRNTGIGTADVGGWWLVDEKDHRITIPSTYSIGPGGELRVYTGPGDSTTTRYFDGRGQAIWNNSGGDTATLYDESNGQVDTYSYSS